MRRKAKININGRINIAQDFRIRKGKSQKQVAEATHLKPMDISRMERGYNMSLAKYRAVAAYLGLTLDALVRNDLTAAAKCVSAPPVIYHELQQRIRKRNIENEETGNAGEAWVYEQERVKLEDIGLSDMVNPNYANDTESHYDILSYDHDTREPIYIEVKATTGNGNNPINMTAGEYELLHFCVKNGYRYELHRVSYVNIPAKREDKVYTAAALLECYTFHVHSYTGMLKGAA